MKETIPDNPPRPPSAKLQTETQVSAGGVVIRRRADQLPELAVIAVGPQNRWQLPKGLIDAGETPEMAAAREVHEETGIEGKLIAPLEVVEYWYVTTRWGARIRYHKFVHFFLFEYEAGNVANHDREVNEARWVNFDEALQLLAFVSERHVVALTQTMIENPPTQF